MNRTFKPALLVLIPLLLACSLCFGQGTWERVGASPISGLVGWWKFDEGSGTSAADSSGNGNTGTASGTTVVAGKIGNARSFNGTSDYIAVGNPASLQITGDVSMCAWAYPQGFSDFIFSKGDYGNNYDYSLYITGAGLLALYYGSNNIVATTSIVVWSFNVWQHLCAVVQSTNVTFYVNGVPYSASGTATIANTNQQFDIGDSDGGWRFHGIIDELRIYNRALSAAEVWRIYNGAP
jgi:hypothetical protein